MASIAGHTPCTLTNIDRETDDHGIRLLRDGSRQDQVRLNPTAAEIWSRCDGRRTILEISRALEGELELPEGSLYEDIESTVRQFVDSHLVVLRSPDPAPALDGDVDWRRVAEPQEDGYDTEAARRLLRGRVERGEVGEYDAGLECGTGETGRDIMDGRVRIAFPYDIHRQGFEHLCNAHDGHDHIDTAVGLLRHWTTGYEQFKDMMSVVQPVALVDQPFSTDVGLSYCHSAEWMYGTMWSTINCPLLLAENLVHELAHQKAFALGIYKEVTLGLIINAPAQQFTSPFKDYARPMSAVFHAAYAIAYMFNLNIVLARAGIGGSLGDKNTKRLTKHIELLPATLDSINAAVELDEAGKEFLEGLKDWADRLVAHGSRFTAHAVA